MSLSTLRRSNTLSMSSKMATLSNTQPAHTIVRPDINWNVTLPNNLIHNTELDKFPTDLNPQYQQWLQQFRSCIQHLQNPDFDRVDKNKDIQQLTQYWLENYYDFNLEQDNLSRTDLLFYIRCFLLTCHRGPKAREIIPITELNVLFNRIAMFSCNHNCQFKASYPTVAQIEQLENEVASFMLQHFYSSTRIRQYVDMFKADFQYLEEVEKNKGIPLREYKVMEMEKLSPEMKLLKKQLFIRNEKEPNANIGWLWSQTSIEMFTKFIPLCTRVFSHVYREQQLYEAYPIRSLLISKQAIQKLHLWLKKEASIDAEDDLRLRFAELAHELQIPMGGRLQTQRKAVTRDDHPTALTILENELGYDTSLRLSDMAKTKPPIVAEDPNHELYTALLFTLMDIRLEQTKKTSLLKDYVVLPTVFANLHTLPKKQFHIESKWGRKRTPLITYLHKTWMIHFDKTWWKCDSASEAILGWIRFIVTEYDGEIPNSGGINIKQDYYNPFFHV
jgi:hypothetical protein